MSAAGIKPSDLSKLGANPTTWLSNWNSITGAPGATGQAVSQVFGAAPKQGLLWHPTLKGAGVKVSKAVAGSAAGGVGAATLGVVATHILAPLGIGLALSAGAVMFLRKKGEKSSRAQLLQVLLDEMAPLKCDDVQPPPPEGKCSDEQTAAGMTWNPETEECECPDDGTWNPETKECEKIDPPPPEPPEAKRLGLLRLDDDGVKVYIGTRRSQTQRDYERDVMQTAQDNVITGRNTDPTTDDLNKPPGGFRMDKRYSKSAEDSEWDDLRKAVKGRSRRDPEPYVTVDASVYNDAAKALRKGGVKTRANARALKKAVKDTVESLLLQYINNKKKFSPNQARQKIRSRFGRAKIKLTDSAIVELIRALQDYGLVQSGELRESLTLNRWKVLSGIK
jgi:hypothetical protein